METVISNVRNVHFSSTYNENLNMVPIAAIAQLFWYQIIQGSIPIRISLRHMIFIQS